MRKDFLPFSKPSVDQLDIDAVNDVLRSGWITTGAKNTKFEQLFSDYIGCKHAVACSSATAGMHLALRAFGVGPSDEVITPSMTWVSTINQIVLAGAKPVFVDVDKDTLMVSADMIQDRLTDRTKMVIPVHFAGSCVDMNPIRQLSIKRNIVVIEDAAHALGTEYNHELVGRQETAIFSFHPIKNMTTAEGGMVCSDNDEFVERVRRMRFHGISVDAYDRRMQGRTPQAEVLEPGFKYNLPDVLAALGISQLSRLNEFNARRTRIAKRYLHQLKEVQEIIPFDVPSYTSRHSWHLFIIRLDINKTRLTRDEFMEKLKAKNIGTGLHFKPAHLQKYYRETMPDQGKFLPNTEWNAKRICSLPLFPDMTDEDVDEVVETIKEILS